jgi:hypothetical protein
MNRIPSIKVCGLHSIWCRGFIPQQFGSLRCRQGRVIWDFLANSLLLTRRIGHMELTYILMYHKAVE